MQIDNDAEELGKILRIRNRIAASQSVLSRKWISDTGVFVMAAENAVHFVEGEDDILADAFRAETSGRLIGVANFSCCSPRMSGMRCCLPLRENINSSPAHYHFFAVFSLIFPRRSGSLSSLRTKSFPTHTLRGLSLYWKMLFDSWTGWIEMKRWVARSVLSAVMVSGKLGCVLLKLDGL